VPFLFLLGNFGKLARAWASDQCALTICLHSPPVKRLSFLQVVLQFAKIFANKKSGRPRPIFGTNHARFCSLYVLTLGVETATNNQTTYCAWLE
jgi:hypothetical protein